MPLANIINRDGDQFHVDVCSDDGQRRVVFVCTGKRAAELVRDVISQHADKLLSVSAYNDTQPTAEPQAAPTASEWKPAAGWTRQYAGMMYLGRLRDPRRVSVRVFEDGTAMLTCYSLTVEGLKETRSTVQTQMRDVHEAMQEGEKWIAQ